MSCDLLPTEIEGEHYQGDVFDIINDGWDLLIAHPPCTYLTCAGNRWFLPQYKNRFPDRLRQRDEAIDFFMYLATVKIKRKAIENPIGIMSSVWRKPDQIIQPYHFGHTERKSTCLGLKNLAPLTYSNIVEPEIIYHKSGRTDGKLHFETLKLPKDERAKVRSKTFQGIADAMANQWSNTENYFSEQLTLTF